MSRYFNNFMDDSSETLGHSWGTSPEAKAREKEYNHWYYQKHKDELAAIRKQRHAATNSYKQAEKSHNDARRYAALSGVMDARLLGYHVSNVYKDSDGDYRGKATQAYLGDLKPSAANRLYNAKNKYERMSTESEAKSRKYKIQGARQEASAKAGANRILRDMKNPSAKELAEFYLDTTVEKVKKSASKAANKAKKYATKVMPTVEETANKAKKYVTKTVKSVVR